MEKYFQNNGIDIIIHRTEKFKTLNFLLTIEFPINAEKATTRALLPYLLLEGTTTFPRKHSLQEAIEHLYGTDIKIDLFKSEHTQAFSYYIEIPNDNYQNNNNISRFIALFRSILFDSIIPKQLHSDQINNAKMILKNKHIDIYSNKVLYTNQMLLSKMHCNEPYSIPAIGYKDKIDTIDSATLLDSYKDLVEASQIKLLLIGDIDKKDELDVISNFKRSKYSTERLRENNNLHKNNQIEMHTSVTDSLSYIAIGFRYSGSTPKTNVLKVANALLGRFPSSRLFQILREKEQLCYFVLSQIDMNTKNIIINFIVEDHSKNKAIKMVKEQLNQLKQGQFSEKELEKSKSATRMLLLNAEDSPIGMMDNINQSIKHHTDFHIEKQVEEINNIDKHEVISVLNHLHLDTVYTLGDE